MKSIQETTKEAYSMLCSVFYLLAKLLFSSVATDSWSYAIKKGGGRERESSNYTVLKVGFAVYDTRHFRLILKRCGEHKNQWTRNATDVRGGKASKVNLNSDLLEDGIAFGKSAGLMIEMLRVRIPAEAAGEFSSPVLTFCTDSYSGVLSIPVLPQWYVKDPGHSAKSAGGRFN